MSTHILMPGGDVAYCCDCKRDILPTPKGSARVPECRLCNHPVGAYGIVGENTQHVEVFARCHGKEETRTIKKLSALPVTQRNDQWLRGEIAKLRFF